jgi:hypothetical protein
MSSIIRKWRGCCPSRYQQNKLLAFIHRFAGINEQFRLLPPPKRPKVLEILAGLHEPSGPTLTYASLFDHEITGRILVRSDLFEDKQAIAEAASRQGIEWKWENPSRPDQFLLCLDRLRLRGLDFRLFDPRRLYPGEDRMGFVFLESPQFPALSGLLSMVEGADYCQRYSDEFIERGDWYVQCPYLHLRYYLEEWTISFLAWTKYFFIADLSYHGWNGIEEYEGLSDAFDALENSVGSAKARRMIFDRLMEEFAREVEQWTDQLATW